VNSLSSPLYLFLFPRLYRLPSEVFLKRPPRNFLLLLRGSRTRKITRFSGPLLMVLASTVITAMMAVFYSLMALGDFRPLPRQQSQSQSYFTTGGSQPISSSYDVLSEERMGLSFTIAASPRLRSHSRVTVPRDSRPHFAVSDSRLPQPRGPGPCIYFSQEQGGPVIPPDTGLPFRCLLRLAGLWWGYSNPPPHGPRIRSNYIASGRIPQKTPPTAVLLLLRA
jgi:hypothetical protein